MSKALIPTEWVPPTRCIECGRFNDAATYAYGHEPHYPRPGDVSFCIGCGHLAVFTADLCLREPTIEEHLTLARDPKIRVLQKKHKEIMQDGGAKKAE